LLLQHHLQDLVIQHWVVVTALVGVQVLQLAVGVEEVHPQTTTGNGVVMVLVLVQEDVRVVTEISFMRQAVAAAVVVLVQMVQMGIILELTQSILVTVVTVQQVV